jgi:preprotein translocase subunit SecG
MLLNILLAAVIVVCIALIGVILLQRSEGGVLGASSGTGSFMTARGTGDLLTRTTMILAAIFFGLCLLMTLVTGHLRREESLTSKLNNLAINPAAGSSRPAGAPAAAPAQPAPAAPAAPAQPAPPIDNGLNLFGPNGQTRTPRLVPTPAAPATPARPAHHAAAASQQPAVPVLAVPAPAPSPAPANH